MHGPCVALPTQGRLECGKTCHLNAAALLLGAWDVRAAHLPWEKRVRGCPHTDAGYLSASGLQASILRTPKAGLSD